MYFNYNIFFGLVFSLIPLLLDAECQEDLIGSFLEGKMYSYEVSKVADQLEEKGGLYCFAAEYEGSIDETRAVELNAKYDNPESVTRFLRLLYSARLTYRILDQVYAADKTSEIANGIYVLEGYGLFDAAISREYFNRNLLSNIQASVFFVNRSLRYQSNWNINILPLFDTKRQTVLDNNFIFVWCFFLMQGPDVWKCLDRQLYDKWLKHSKEDSLYSASDISPVIKYIRDSSLSQKVNHKAYLDMCESRDSLGYFFLLYYLHVHHHQELPGKYKLEEFAEKYASSLKEYGLELVR